MQPIRVLQVFTILNRGGAETMIMNYYRKIDRSKVQFDFLVHRSTPGAYEEEIKNMGGRVYRLSPIHPRYFHQYQKEVRQFFETHKEYQIIHSHISELGYFLYKEAERQGIPYIICHAHTSKMNIDLKSPFRIWWKYGVRHMSIQRMTCSKQAADWLFGEREVVSQINNAVDTELFSYNAHKAEELRAKFKIKNKVILGHVGTFNKIKNHHFLLQTFAQLRERRNDMILVLAGQGPLEEKVKQEVRNLGLEKDIIFLGCRSDIYDILQMIDVLVFPSLYEGLPVTLIEAQATGLTCLISDRISKDVDMSCGLVHFLSIQDTKKWVEEIDRLIENIEQLRRKRASQADTLREKGYDIEQEACRLEQFYMQQNQEEKANETINYCVYPNLQ